MTSDTKLVSATYQKAVKKLSAAKNALTGNEPEEVVSRAYYAVFHATNALLLSQGIEAKSHAGTKSLFGIHFIQTGKIDGKFAKYLRNLKDDREESDYAIYSSIDESDAETALQEANEFLAMTKTYLTNLGIPLKQ